jgi:biotin carboxylase
LRGGSPGYGFLAENPVLVRACEDSGLVFIGPGADVMERMGDKVRAKKEMRAAGVPLVPGTDGTGSLDELRKAAAGAGYPVLLKAASGGGGKGMRLVSSEEVERAYAAAGARPRLRSEMAPCISRRPSPRLATWRFRSSATTRGTSSPSASASARSSAGTRS